MPVISARKIGDISEGSVTDPKKALWDAVGREVVDRVEVFFNRMLVGTYIRPTHYSLEGGHKMFLPDSAHKDDQFQSKVGMVLKKGSLCFVDDQQNTFVDNVEVGDWVVYWIGSGRQLILNGVHCRILEDSHIMMRVPDPEWVHSARGD